MTKPLLALVLLLSLAACSSEAAKRAAYEAAYQKSCTDRTGNAQCDPNHPSYDEYRKQRSDPQQAEPPGR
ncbi:hypothetical protein SAMN04488038_10614 [Solimonas aquatica]|uniref:Lipoprotein n=1 Tax=Solimonas aquatica TaxID=489703 RepID=A0A1H9FKB9_9GAMM|nr:hypothetical protein [Solimonas aquatica]SEQ38329.1 hypothetical protein SAMN04488038_10614 [Solimonas aquatica]